MTKAQAKKRIEKLGKVISYHRYLYHVLDREEISSDALDSLKHELYKLEQQYPEFITPDSPTQRVAGKPLEGFQKVEHKAPMLSIEDIFSEEELYSWQDYLKRFEPVDFNYFSELKIDGFAVTLIYKRGFFICGATRGNGKIGENVTQNLKTIESIPLSLKIHSQLSSEKIKEKLKEIIKKGELEIRGEVYMEKQAFEKFNEERKKKGEEPYANPRNLAAGSIRQLNPKLAASRSLKFLAYDLVTDIGQKSHFQKHQILEALGFRTDKTARCCKNLQAVINYWREVAKKREILPFLIDGIVINVNDNFLFQKLGVVGKSSRGIRAFKFIPKQATTKILDIKVQIGRTGAITPIAALEPVKVEGVTISRATLHNEDELKKLQVMIGDTVIVERAGDVIPAVNKVLRELRTGQERKFKMPKICPFCRTKLVRPINEVIWRCPNSNCGARQRELLGHFVSKKGFDIKGLGPKIIDKLLDENLISQAYDLFNLTEGDLVPIERFAEKSAKNLVKGIQESKKIPFARFIFALGIRYVGEETAIVLAEVFKSIKKLKKASREDLEAIRDIGTVGASSIYDWFHSERNKKLIEGLEKRGVKILVPKKIGKKLAGKTFVLTGTLKNLTRAEAQRRIRVLGGHPLSSVSKQTDFLIIGKNSGSKFELAKQFGVKIIRENEFLKMLR